MNDTIAIPGLEPFLPVLRKRNGTLPAYLEILFDGDRFKDDVLDVAPMYPFAEPSKCKITFSRLPQDLFTIGRLLARFELFFGKAPRTVQQSLNVLTSFHNDMKARRSNCDFLLIDIKDVRRVLNDGRRSANGCAKVCIALKYFFMLAGSIYDRRMFNMDMKALDALRGEYARLAAATKNASKTPDIDQEYFDELNVRLPMIAIDETVPINYRMTALEIWLEMWTGLRASEPLTLKTTSHFKKTATNGRVTDYLRYTPIKLQHGGRIQVCCDCYALPMALTAFDMLCETRKKIPGWEQTDRLFILDSPSRVEKGLEYYYEKLFTTYLKDLSTLKWNDVKCHTKRGGTYWYPNATQFRVHLCGWLYRQNVSIPVVELGMSHLSKAMEAYYVRANDKTFSLQKRHSDNIIRTRLGNDFALDETGRNKIGDRLLGGLLLNLNMYRVAKERYEEMLTKGYEYEAGLYGKQILGLIDAELRPALGYMERMAKRDGWEAVLKAYPSLRLVKDRTEELNDDFEIWQGKVSKK